ncbi:hypothetical protein DsansV1_C11g0107491 [Dioscorea sansibarensis]
MDGSPSTLMFRGMKPALCNLQLKLLTLTSTRALSCLRMSLRLPMSYFPTARSFPFQSNLLFWGSFWLLGRSGSDGFSSKVSSIYSFRRSKSAGPHDRVNMKHNKNMNISSGGSNQNSNSNSNTSPFRHKGCTDSSSKRTYYYSGIKPRSQGTGVRIDPVLNVPYLSRGSNSSGNSSCRSSSNSSIFGYFICKCSN